MSSTSDDKVSRDALASLTYRLEKIDAIITGAGLPILKNSSSTKDLIASRIPLQKRVESIQNQLEQLSIKSESIKAFLDTYEEHLPFLYAATPNLSMSTPAQPSHSVQAHLVHSALPSLQLLHSQLKELSDLEILLLDNSTTQMENGCRSSDILLAQNNLNSSLQTKKLEDLTKSVWELADRYNKVTDTTSQIFITWNHLLTAAEEHVSRLEKEQRTSGL